MGRNLHYGGPNGYYMTSDISGLVFRASQMRRQWDGVMAGPGEWSPRQPQELVRGVKDNQSVPVARPLGPESFVGPLYGVLASAAVAQAASVTLEDASGIGVGVSVGVMTDGGSFERRTASTVNITTGVVGLSAPLTYPAPSGAAFIVYGSTP